MDSINEIKGADPFPFNSLRRLLPQTSPDFDKASHYSARSYDNRSRISDIADALRSKLGYFQTRISSSSFLSDIFSWQVKTAVTSDPDRILARGSLLANKKKYSLEIDSLASTRTVISDKLVSDDTSVFETGIYSYTLTIGEDSHAIDLNLENDGAHLSNRSVLLDIERSINRLGLDVKARLYDTQQRDYSPRENAYKDISYLKIESKTTGEDIQFSLSDTGGDLIEKLNLDRVRLFGRKNQFRVDGVLDHSNSNKISLDQGNVSAYLLGTSDSGEKLQINISRDKKVLALELTTIIDDYNELIRWMDDNNSVISSGLKTAFFKDLSSNAVRNRTLKRDIGNNDDMIKVNGRSRIKHESRNTIDLKLMDIGLMLQNDGTLDISEDFATSVSSNLRNVYDALGGTNGFFTKISESIKSIHNTSESNYVFSFNSILTYNAKGTNRRSIYKANSPSIISLFA